MSCVIWPSFTSITHIEYLKSFQEEKRQYEDEAKKLGKIPFHKLIKLQLLSQPMVICCFFAADRYTTEKDIYEKENPPEEETTVPGSNQSYNPAPKIKKVLDGHLFAALFH